MTYDANGFIIVIRTGKGGTLSPVMPWIVFRNLDDADLRALHAFLGTLHPVQHFVSNLAPPTYCAICGQKHGLGEMNHVQPLRGIALDPRLFDALVGTYRNDDADWTLHVTRKGRRLMAGDGQQTASELVPLSPTLYVMEGGVAPLRFERDADGKVSRLVSEEGDDLVLQRVTP